MNYEKSNEIYDYLISEFNTPKCELNFKDEYTLLISVILSAQCTDKRVNEVTKKLFKIYPNFLSLSKANIEDVENIIKPCGFYKNKAKNIIKTSEQIINNFNGEVPNNMKELITLAGVGRKTANVVLSNIFNVPSIAVDTHVFRVSNRLGLAKTNKVLDCEKMLQQAIEKERWSDMHHLLVLFGRYICKARNPKCEQCKLKHLCKEYNNGMERCSRK